MTQLICSSVMNCLFLLMLCITELVSGLQDQQGISLSHLRQQMTGEVLPCCGERYQRRRIVNNRACVARPLVILRPRSAEDVAVGIDFARRNGLQVKRIKLFLKIKSFISR